jgi:hypothetical protein
VTQAEGVLWDGSTAGASAGRLQAAMVSASKVYTIAGRIVGVPSRSSG